MFESKHCVIDVFGEVREAIREAIVDCLGEVEKRMRVRKINPKSIDKIVEMILEHRAGMVNADGMYGYEGGHADISSERLWVEATFLQVKWWSRRRKIYLYVSALRNYVSLDKRVSLVDIDSLKPTPEALYWAWPERYERFCVTRDKRIRRALARQGLHAPEFVVMHEEPQRLLLSDLPVSWELQDGKLVVARGNIQPYYPWSDWVFCTLMITSEHIQPITKGMRVPPNSNEEYILSRLMPRALCERLVKDSRNVSVTEIEGELALEALEREVITNKQ